MSENIKNEEKTQERKSLRKGGLEQLLAMLGESGLKISESAIDNTMQALQKTTCDIEGILGMVTEEGLIENEENSMKVEAFLNAILQNLKGATGGLLASLMGMNKGFSIEREDGTEGYDVLDQVRNEMNAYEKRADELDELYKEKFGGDGFFRKREVVFSNDKFKGDEQG